MTLRSRSPKVEIRDKTYTSVSFFIAKNKSVESGARRYYRHIIRVGVNKALDTKDAILVPPYLKIYEAKLFNKNAAATAASLSSPFFSAHKLWVRAATIGLPPRNVTLRLARE
jgi:hypothetical protein